MARGVAVAMEELLIVDANGRAEDRGLGFWSTSPSDCANSQGCSDAPLIATARLAVKGDLVTVSERKETAQRINRANADLLIRRLAVTATPAWTVTYAEGLLILRSATANITLAFARIEPNRLRRIRAGILVNELSAQEHWRCLFANATARDPAFAPLRTGGHAAPGFLDAYLHAASYLYSLGQMGGHPRPDDRNEKMRPLAAGGFEQLAVERFPDVPIPKTETDAQRLNTRFRFLYELGKGRTVEQAIDNVETFARLDMRGPPRRRRPASTPATPRSRRSPASMWPSASARKTPTPRSSACSVSIDLAACAGGDLVAWWIAPLGGCPPRAASCFRRCKQLVQFRPDG